MVHHFAVGVFDDVEAAHKALKTLVEKGFGKGQIAVIGKTTKEKVDETVWSKIESDVAFWGAQGGIWGSILGLLLGGSLFVIPGIGPIVGAGPIAGALAGFGGGLVAGATAVGLVDALVEWGLGSAKAKHYKELIGEGKVLVLVRGKIQEVEDAAQILRSLDAEEVEFK
ncbi:hypothetical protein [Nitratifractor sp.]|uniref:hypothetical protein n=1 Tax=Nitratifractor sp. TaxID=2268144 RepID=UPI0025F950E0|nr:hypothetical protein [Nitratifractor sp.]